MSVRMPGDTSRRRVVRVKRPRGEAQSTPAATASWEVRFQLSRDVVHELGRGGFAVVRRGVDTVTQQPVAVKCFIPGDQPGKDASQLLEQFEREVRMLRILHESVAAPVVGLLDYSRHGRADIASAAEDGSCYLVLEMGECTLSGWMAQRNDVQPLPLAQVSSVLRQLVACLAFLETRGYVALDFKPSNVMRFASGWKLIDCEAILPIGTLVDRRVPRRPPPRAPAPRWPACCFCSRAEHSTA